MINVLDFTSLTDTGSLKNDDSGTATLTILSGTTLTASEFRIFTTDIVVGSANSSALIFIENNQDPVKRYPLSVQKTYTRNGSLGAYNPFPSAYRLNSTTIRCQVIAKNPYGSSMTTAAFDDVYTFHIRTFIEPF